MASFPQDKPRGVGRKGEELERKTSQTVNKEKRRSVRSIPVFPANRYIIRRTNPEEEYERISPLGVGSFGTVYKCLNKETKKIFAVKTIKEDERHKEEDLKREIGFLVHCVSDFVCQFFDAFFFNGKLTIVLEHFESGSVHDVMKMAKMKMPEDFIYDVAAQGLLALDFLQSRRVMHRDIKCGNLLLTLDGRTKLCDFGVSRLFNPNEQYTKTIIGTPYWMAPEIVAQTGYSYNADVWSLGITVIEMKDGGPPLSKLAAIRAMYVAQRRPAPTFLRPAKASKGLKELLAKLVVKERKDRLDAAELLKDEQVAPIIFRLASAEPQYSSEAVKRVVTENLDKVVNFRLNTKFNDGDEEESEDDNDGSVLVIGKNKKKGKPKKAVAVERQESLVQLGDDLGDRLRETNSGTQDENSENGSSLVEVENPTFDSDIESLVLLAIEPVDEDSGAEDNLVVVEENDEVPAIQRLNSGKSSDSGKRSRNKVTFKGKGFRSSFLVRKSKVRFQSANEKSHNSLFDQEDAEDEAGTAIFDPSYKEVLQLRTQKKKLQDQTNMDIRFAVEMYRKQLQNVDEAVAFKKL